MLKTRKQNRKTSVKPENKAENKTKPTGNKKKKNVARTMQLCTAVRTIRSRLNSQYQNVSDNK